MRLARRSWTVAALFFVGVALLTTAATLAQFPVAEPPLSILSSAALFVLALAAIGLAIARASQLKKHAPPVLLLTAPSLRLDDRAIPWETVRDAHVIARRGWCRLDLEVAPVGEGAVGEQVRIPDLTRREADWLYNLVLAQRLQIRTSTQATSEADREAVEGLVGKGRG